MEINYIVKLFGDDSLFLWRLAHIGDNDVSEKKLTKEDGKSFWIEFMKQQKVTNVRASKIQKIEIIGAKHIGMTLEICWFSGDGLTFCCQKRRVSSSPRAYLQSLKEKKKNISVRVFLQDAIFIII